MSIEVKKTDLDFSEIHERMQWYVDQEIIPCCNTLVLQGTDAVSYTHLTLPTTPYV